MHSGISHICKGGKPIAVENKMSHLVPSRMKIGRKSSPPLFRLHVVVIDESNLEDLVALSHHDPPRVTALAVDLRKAPDHVGGPAGHGLDVALDVQLTLRTAFLFVSLEPALPQVGVFDGIGIDEARLTMQLAEDVVLMLALLPVQGAQLRGALQPAGGGLLDVDVHDPSVVLVLLDVEVDGGQADERAGKPADALKREDWVRVVGESLVLEKGSKSVFCLHVLALVACVQGSIGRK